MDVDGDGTRSRGRSREAKANDHSVLEAARSVFSEFGYSAPMSAIANRAGVGVASIYRRYPSKDTLVHDLRLLAMQQVTEFALEAANAPGSGIRAYLESTIRRAASPLINTFGRDIGLGPEVDAASGRLRVALEALVARAIDAGDAPADYSAAELMIALTHLNTSLPTDRDRQVEIHLRQLDIYLAGLRAAAADRPLVRGEPMRWPEWLELNSVTVDTSGVSPRRS